MLARGALLLACAVGVLLVLIAVGQPLFADDLWWHLALGEVYARQGLALAEDPFLFTAVSPPAPAAWLAQLLLHGAESLVGFQGLRLLHVGLVIVLLLLVFGRGLRAPGGSLGVAASSVLLFALLGAYRLIQLRPHLFTMLGALLLFWLVVELRLPSWRRVSTAILIQGLWANLHAGFLLGPILLGAATLGVAGQLAAERGAHPETRQRVLRLAVALGLGLVASVANPMGIEPHLLYFAAGAETPGLSAVRDEWSTFRLFDLPVANLPPSPLSWLLMWGLLLATPWAAWALLRDGRSGSAPGSDATRAVDPARIAVALAGLGLALAAVRFLWLAVFGWLLVCDAVGRREAWRAWRGPAAALACAALVAAFPWIGAWPMISRAVSLDRYAAPYPAAKWNAHAVWWLADSGVDGRLWSSYSSGGFIGYWLSQGGVKVFLNGSLNVPKAVMTDYGALLARRAAPGDEDFAATLDRHRIDLFLGTGLAALPRPNRPPEYTVAHLERTPGWLLVFRSLRTAIYLRDQSRNRENLERIAAYYADAGISFDPQVGFDPIGAALQAPGWAYEHGVIPRDYRAAETRAAQGHPAGLARLASLHAALGAYASAILLDRRLLEQQPALPAARRKLWCHLHLRQLDEARNAALRLRELATPADALSHALVQLVDRVAADPDSQRTDALIAILPLLSDGQVARLLAGSVEAEPRDSPLRAAAGAHGEERDE